MMQTEELIFSDATGIAVDFLRDGKFDMDGFEKAVRDQAIVNIVSGIAKEYLAVDDLFAQPDLKAALVAAYKAGQQSV